MKFWLLLVLLVTPVVANASLAARDWPASEGVSEKEN